MSRKEVCMRDIEVDTKSVFRINVAVIQMPFHFLVATWAGGSFFKGGIIRARVLPYAVGDCRSPRKIRRDEAIFS